MTPLTTVPTTSYSDEGNDIISFLLHTSLIWIYLISNLNSYYINIWTSCWYQCDNDYNINCVHYCCNINDHWVSTQVLHTLVNYYIIIIL